MATSHKAPVSVAETETIQNGGLLESIIEKRQSVADRYKPVLSIKESIERYEEIKKYIAAAMIEGEDYGKVPGVEKPFLFQAGAQKLCVLFGYVPRYELDVEIEEWNGNKYGEPLYYYRIRCILERDGSPVGQGIGSASSWESKYRYRWVAAADVPPEYKGMLERGELKTRDGKISEFAFAIDKAETNGQYGKPADYWAKWKEAVEKGDATETKRKTRTGKEMAAYEMGAPVFRVPNPDIADSINTVQKIGTKRALVGSTITATGLSGLFTQDEDSGALPEAAYESSSNSRRAEDPQKSDAPLVDQQLDAILKQVKGPKDLGNCFLEVEKRLLAVDSALGRTVYDKHLKRFNEGMPDKAKRLVSDYIQCARGMWIEMRELEQMKAGEKAHAAENADAAQGDGYDDTWPDGKE